MEEETRIQTLIDYLQGTCKSLGEGCNDLEIDEEDLTDDELEELDLQIFNCSQCGWWSEICEDSGTGEGEFICNDCADSD